MGDSQEKSETAEKDSEHEIITPQETGRKPEKISVTKIVSEEKVQKLHEAIASKCSVKSTTGEKTHDDKEKSEEKPAPTKETKDRDPEEPNKNEGGQLENQIKTTEQQRVSNSVVFGSKEPREKIIRNQSDIFSLKVVPTTLQTSIFSVNGCPSRKVFLKKEPAGHLFQRNEDPPADKMETPDRLRITKENYNDEKRPSSSYRNPLTGSGLSSNDEYKSKGTKRKDGNPLLGLGYDTEVTSVASQHRIPPGGYSHKLW